MDRIFRLISLNAARVIFVGSLLLALYVGLTWALAIEDRPDAASIAAAQAALDASESAVAEANASEVTAAPVTESEAPTEVPPTIDPQELISAAKPPGETTVQVLEAGGGAATVDSVVRALEAIGYNIVAESQSSQRKVERTTVYFTDDNDPQAEGLRARDPRFQDVEANRGLSASVDIHVLVGPDF